MPLHDHGYASKKIKLDDEASYKRWKVSEHDAAITEYLNDGQSFSAIIKHRCQDFIVHEILNGNEVRLTDLRAPIITGSTDSGDSKTVCSQITPEIHEKLAQLSQRKHCDDDEDVEIEADLLSKEERTCVHKYVKENFDNLETSYENRDGRKVIIVVKKGRSDRRSDMQWPQNLPDHVHFTLFHEYHGTFEAIEKIARFSGRSGKSFSYAGTKDKRSVSSQRVSAYRQNIEKLMKVNEILGEQGNPVLVGNLSFEKEPLLLGSADGNRFDIVLRSLTCKREADVHEAVRNISEKGFINYFGTQRFGMNASPSHQIGIAVLKKDWLKVIDLILAERTIDFESPRPNKNKTFNECMRLWKTTRDPDLVLKEFGWPNRMEAKILKAIAASSAKNNYFQGFQRIPRNQRLMYLHAYQSLLWNRLASHRIKKYGLSVIPGDLVIKRDEQLPNDENFRNIKPHKVSSQEVSQFTIYDVVIPIFGANSILPENDLKDKLIEFLSEENFDFSTFDSNWKELNLTGSYRFLLCKPQNVETEIVSYEEEEKPLFLTDLDIIKGNQLPPSEGSKKALKLSFLLPSSTYATVLLRELMKKDLYSLDQ